ncbi:ankyrin repeat-containing domain protein [Bisporella sp. PMI_857]|nr:ankyrin repeat-containing domain protein [Bisporella sp. PMI_857]
MTMNNLNDQPPPPYSAYAPSEPLPTNSDSNGPISHIYSASSCPSSRNGVAQSPPSSWARETANANTSSLNPGPSPLYRPSESISTPNINSEDIERSGFVSAAPYFELRPYNQTRPVVVTYHQISVNNETDAYSLPFPEPSDLWHLREVHSEDWTAFLNHLFPGKELSDPPTQAAGRSSPVCPEKAKLHKQQRPLSRPGPVASSSFSQTEHLRLRDVRINLVVSQWNTSFFEPRGLGVQVYFSNQPNFSNFSSQRIVQTRGEEETLLHRAVDRGSKSTVREALKKGAYIETLNKKGETPLYRAVTKRDKAIVQILLEYGANPTSYPFGSYTSLQYAASHDCKSILKLLLERSTAEIDAQTSSGETALYLAVQKRCSLNTAQVLIFGRPTKIACST